jgi:hypothetical protein
MNPGEIRERITLEHTVLRGKLAELEGMLSQLEHGWASCSDAERSCRALYEKMCAHLDLEDAVLVPALREVDAWGGVRADSLLQHHQAQRQELRVLLDPENTDVARLSRRLSLIIAELRADMAHEERDILSLNLLRDDVVAIDFSDG